MGTEKQGLNMTIHHDKMAYGKLAKTSRELTDEEVLNVLAELDESQEEEQKTENTDNKKSK